MLLYNILVSMKIPEVFKSLSKLEIGLLVVFMAYIVLPIPTPTFLSGMIDSPLGMLVIFLVTLYLFFYTNPVLAIIYVFVAYELLRRSSIVTGRVAMIQYTPSQAQRDVQMKAMNPPQFDTLEEKVIQKMAPIGHSDPSTYLMSSYKPVAEDVGGASLV
jgi:hypothetical protein